MRRDPYIPATDADGSRIRTVLNTRQDVPIHVEMIEVPPVTARWEFDPTGRRRAALLDELPDAVLVTDRSARLLWGNRAAEELFGRTLDETVGIDCTDLVHPADLEMAVVSLGSMQTERVGLPLELRIDTPGGWRQVELIGSTHGDEIVLVVRDLTNRRRWEVAHDHIALLRNVLQHITTVAMVVDPDGHIRSTSAAITRLLGLGQRQAEGSHLTQLVPGDQRVALGRALHDALAAPEGDTVTVDVDAKCKDRTRLPVTMSMVNLVDDPTVSGLIVTMHDMSRRSAAERALHDANAVLGATLDSVADGIVAADIDGRIRTCNQQFFEVWQMPPELVAGADLGQMTDHIRSMVEDPDGLMARIDEINSDPHSVSEDTIEFLDGRVIERRSRPRFVDGEAVGRVWSFRDVTSTRRLQAELARQALHDPLTGLANQVLFRRRLEVALESASDGRNVAAMFVDLDDFKAVNDTLGHSAGDLLLIEVGERLRTAVRPEDTVARLGGDEFAVILQDVDGDESAIEVARRLMEALSQPVELAQGLVVVGASIGVAVADASLDPDGLLRCSDLAMYHAKRSGRNQFRLYTPEMGQDGSRSLADTRLRGAANRGELVVHYQPIVDPGRDDVIVVAEALVRWMHPERGLLLPTEFIPYAETSGVIDEIGLHVMEAACRQAQQWQEQFGADAPMVSVNLSPHQLLDDHLPERVSEVIDDAGLDPTRLVLEFTEGALMQDPASVVRQIRSIRRRGVHLAIDDFGTGHSSLARLQQFPITTLKIDRTFVQHVGDRTGSSLVEAIVQLAHTLGMLTVAEGVETEAQQQRLVEIGADLCQGFLFHRPMPADELTPILARQSLAASPLR